ncbi:MAG: hypothetical protein EOP06_15105 [Proteobacteria bacterium]|nr:MAG: hypothetical protein EOP06_15105 [Pseudomonadota bacterium]
MEEASNLACFIANGTERSASTADLPLVNSKIRSDASLSDAKIIESNFVDAGTSGKIVSIDSKGNALIGNWSSTRNFSSVENAQIHWSKHAGEFPEYTSSAQYARAAQSFVTAPPLGTLIKYKPNGDTVYYSAETNTFAVKDLTGAPRTMFKPVDGIEYWRRQ